MNQEIFTDKNGDYLTWEGFAIYTNPDMTEWSNIPYTKEQKSHSKAREKDSLISEKIIEHLERKNRTLKQEYGLIINKKFTLSSTCKKWFLEHVIIGNYKSRDFNSRGTLILPNN